MIYNKKVEAIQMPINSWIDKRKKIINIEQSFDYKRNKVLHDTTWIRLQDAKWRDHSENVTQYIILFIWDAQNRPSVETELISTTSGYSEGGLGKNGGITGLESCEFCEIIKFF